MRPTKPTNPLDPLRERALNALLVLAAVIGTLVLIIISLTLDTLQSNSLMLATLALVQITELTITLFRKHIPYRWVAGLFTFYILFISISILVVTGPLPAPFLIMSIALLSVGVFFDERMSRIMLGVTALSFAGVIILHINGLTIQPTTTDLNLSIPKNAVRVFGVSFCLLVVISQLVTYLVKQAEGALAKLQQETEERMLAEERQRDAERALQRAQKMESLGQLSGSIAHDFNNALAVVQVWNELLRQDPQDTDLIEEATEEIQQAVVTASALTTKLLAFASREVHTNRNCKPALVLTQNLKSLRSILPKDITLSTTCTSEALIAISDNELQQIIFNVVINARDAMPTGGEFSIQIRDLGPDEPLPAEMTLAPALMIECKDNGQGIPTEHLERVMEPFFTTKPQSKGTGLGLASVYGIVRGAKGSVQIQSKLGGGTTVQLIFPHTEEAAPRPQNHITDKHKARPLIKKSILVVEDEAALLKSIVKLLEHEGYHVLAARDGLEAIEVTQRHDIDLICTDAIMPRMGARGLLDHCKEHLPDIPILVCSAHVDEELLRRGLSDGQHPFIQKPFSKQELLNKINLCFGEA